VFDIGSNDIVNSIILEMRKMELINIGEELYEVVKRVPTFKFTKEVAGENAEVLRKYYNVEKILRSNQTNEYLFVNLIPEVNIINDDEQRENESQS